MENEKTVDRNDISVIKILKLFQKYISTINVAPLTVGDVDLNKDAYAELGGEYDEETSY